MSHPFDQNDGVDPQTHTKTILGETFLNTLVSHKFSTMGDLFQPLVRFRALLPSKLAEASTNTEAVHWFEQWFGNYEEIQVQNVEVEQVSDRLYLTYRLRTHHPQNGWRLIEQHLYCMMEEDRIADIWLLCSGFRPDVEGQPVRPHFGGDAFYGAGDRGCAEGPLEEITAENR